MRSTTLAPVLAVALLGLDCSPNGGTGSVKSPRLFASACYTGPYDLGPDFFASLPFLDTQTQRVQRGNDLVENSDGVLILIDTTNKIRSDLLDKPLKVGLSPEVRPPNTPLIVDPDPALVHIALYLNATCHGQNVNLYALSGTITFHSLFDGDSNEGSADLKLTDAEFDVQIGDPRDQPPGGGTVPAGRQSHLIGQYRFYFERGQPGQPFP